MDSNTSSPTQDGTGQAPAGLERLATEIAELAARDPAGLPDVLACEWVLGLRRLVDQLEGCWLRLLAQVDGVGAAGAEQGVVAPSTAGWLHARTRMASATAHQGVRTTRALHRGPQPLQATAAALAAGELSYQHAVALADATRELPAVTIAEAEGVLVEAARRLDPPRVRRLANHLRDVVDPQGAEERGRRRLERRGLWLSSTVEGMLAIDGLLDAECGETLQAALMPLARPAGPDDERSGAQRRADALGEVARHALQAGTLPQNGGLRPRLTVTVELGSLLAAADGQGDVGGVGDWGGVLSGQTVRRLSCDATVTRAIVRRPPAGGGDLDAGAGGHDGELTGRLRQAMGLLPIALGGAASQVLDLGRTTRVISAGLRRALALRDGGCVIKGCDRPPAHCDGHHLHHWADGGQTRLQDLVLVCGRHHTLLHEGGWRIQRDSRCGRVTLTPPARQWRERRHTRRQQVGDSHADGSHYATSA
jgi:hypothetical protein